jgi:hypothetical protein
VEQKHVPSSAPECFLIVSRFLTEDCNAGTGPSDFCGRSHHAAAFELESNDRPLELIAKQLIQQRQHTRVREFEVFR